MSRFIFGLIILVLSPVTASAAPAFVQQNSGVPQSSVSSLSVSYKSSQIAGNTNIVAVGYNDSVHTISSATDSQGNVYSLAVPLSQVGGFSQAIYYASNIKAGANTVKVVLNGATPYVDLRIAEYSGLPTSSPLVAQSSVSGSGTSVTTPITAQAGNLLFAAGMTASSFNGAGAGFTNRVITNPDGDIVEDAV
jgi:hypothetical protein